MPAREPLVPECQMVAPGGKQPRMAAGALMRAAAGRQEAEAAALL